MQEENSRFFYPIDLDDENRVKMYFGWTQKVEKIIKSLGM
jgi:hypothetical protein